jgi:Mn2+/Fe2+ NRAMP family transporter
MLNPMSNQIRTEIHVDLDHRDKNTSLFRIFIAFPALIFLSSFSEFSGDMMGVIGGVLVIPVVLSLLFRNVYPSYVLAFNKALLELSNRVVAYLLVLTDEYPSIEANQKIRLLYPEIDGGKKLSPWLPLVKWFLAIPLFVLGLIYAIYGLALTFVAWISVVRNGIYPEDKADEVVKVIAYWNRLYGYALLLVTDEYPSFSL